MTAARLLRRRARAHAGLLLLVLLQVALTTAAVAGATGYVSVAVRQGAGDTLAAADDAALRVQTSLADDPAAQADAADAVLRERLGSLPGTAWRWTAASALPASRGGEPAGEPLGADAVLWADPRLADAADLEAGAWPTRDDETAVHALAADRLHLAPGDTVTLTGSGDAAAVTLTVTGTWEPRDATDARWAADPLVLDGATDDGAAAGPFVVTPERLADLPGTRYVRWTITPDVDALRPDDVGRLRQALAAVPAALQSEPGVAVQGMSVTGGLPALLAQVEMRVGGIRGVTTAAVVLVALTGLIALSQMARLLADVRLPETVLLRSRGTSVRQLTAASLVEAALVAVVAAVLGAAAARAALAAGQGGPPPLAETALTAGAAAVLATAVLAQRAASQAIGVVRRGRTDVAGRGARAVRSGAVVAAFAAAGLAWWQLDRYGSPVFTDTSGLVRVDPLAAAAVALGLLAVALAATALLAPVTAAVAAAAQRRRDLMPVLTFRELTRHTPVHAVTVVLVVLAAGAATVVGAYAGTLRAWRADVAHTAAGADVVLDLAGAPTGATPVARAALRDPVVDAAVPVRALALRAGSSEGELLAVGRGLPLGPDLDARAGAIAAAAAGPVLPEDGAALRLTATVDAGPGEDLVPGARLWLADDAGELVAVTGRPGSDGTWSADVPDGRWSLVAVDLVLDALPAAPGSPSPADPATDATEAPPHVTYAVTGLTAGGGDLLAAVPRWSAVTFDDAEPVPHETAGASAVLDRDVAERTVGTPVRLLPADVAASAAAPLPVVVTSTWRAGYDVAVGEGTTMRLAGRDTAVTVVGETAVVPGSAAGRALTIPGAAVAATAGARTGRTGGAAGETAALAAVADLVAVNRHLLTTQPDVPAPDAVWVAVTGEPADVAPQVADAVATDGTGETVRTVVARRTATPSADPLSAPAVVATWLAAGCALVVMVPGVASTALALAHARRREAAVLRALGVGPREQSRARQAELAVVCATAVAVGVAGGLVVARLCAGHLVRATAPGPVDLPTALTTHVGGTAAALAATAVLLALVVTGFGAAVAAQVRSATRVEDER